MGVEDEIRELFDDEDSSEDRLHRLIRAEKHSAMGVLVGGVVHDSNNLILPILGFAESGKKRAEKMQDSELAMYFDTILESAERLQRMMNNLLDFSRHGDYTRGTVCINSILEKTIEIFRPQFNNGRVSLISELQEVPEIDGYRAGVESIFSNMLANALQAYKGIPREQPKTVYVRAYHAERRIFVEFEDDGCGISDEDLQKIFDPFYTTKTSGSGLGLAVTLMFVKSHFGKVKVDSKYGRGTKFTLRFPDKTALKMMREETYFGPKRETASGK